MFNVFLNFCDFQWLVILTLVLIVITWFWTRNLLTNFISITNNLIKNSNQLLLSNNHSDNLGNLQMVGVNFWDVDIYILNIIFIIICYYFINEYNYIIWQICINAWSWYYFIIIIFFFCVIASFFQERALTSSVNDELVGVTTAMVTIFTLYMNSSNLFILLIMFEIQNMFFLYFVTVIYAIRQISNLNNTTSVTLSQMSQSAYWQISSLFFQYWASFFGSIGLALSGILWSCNYGSTAWYDLLNFGYFTVVGDTNDWVIYLIGCMFTGSILIKGGLFPFHFWNPDLYNNISSWGMFWYVTIYTMVFFLILITIVSFYLFEWINIWYYIFWFFFVISLGLFINILFSVVELNPFLAYMSIFHLLFILISTIVNFYSGTIYSYMYVFIYVYLMICLFSTLFSIRGNTINYLSDLQMVANLPGVLASFVCFLAAMSGIPPFLGFWGKMGIIISLYSQYEYFLGSLCLFSGLFLLYFYFQNYRFIGTMWDGSLVVVLYIQNSYNCVIFWIIGGLLMNYCIIFFISECVLHGNFITLLNIFY